MSIPFLEIELFDTNWQRNTPTKGRYIASINANLIECVEPDTLYDSGDTIITILNRSVTPPYISPLPYPEFIAKYGAKEQPNNDPASHLPRH